MWAAGAQNTWVIFCFSQDTNRSRTKIKYLGHKPLPIRDVGTKGSRFTGYVNISLQSRGFLKSLFAYDYLQHGSPILVQCQNPSILKLFWSVFTASQVALPYLRNFPRPQLHTWLPCQYPFSPQKGMPSGFGFVICKTDSP